MKRCAKCKSERLRRLRVAETLSVGNFHFEGHVDGIRCVACGEEYLDGPDVGRFEVLIASWLAAHGVASREAFRFMRKAIGINAAVLAGLLDVTPETVSHWETGKHGLPRNAVAILGTMVMDHARGSAETVERLRMLAAKPVRPRRIRLARPAHA